jgi:hypothetical protein
MSLLQENIVYIWLLPVVSQIVLPLAMMLAWAIKIVINAIFQKNPLSESISENQLRAQRRQSSYSVG